MSLRAAPPVPADLAAASVGLVPVPAQAARPWRATLARLARRPSVLIGAAILLFWIVCAITWPILAPYSPTAPDYAHALARPSLQHPAGTDLYGRDVLSRVLAGSSSVLIMAPAAAAIGLLGGVAIGLLSAYYRGWLDDIVNRLLEVVIAFPIIIIALLVLSVFGQSALNTVLVIGVAYIPLVARVVRAAALQVRDLDYVAAARLRGARAPAIMLAEILPNITGPIVVEGTVRVGYAIFATASLGFIGLGSGPDSTDWGSMVSALSQYLPINAWLVLAPTLAIASLVVALNLLADGLGQETGR